MKTKKDLILLIVLLLSVTFSCKKDPVITPAKNITGQWEWIYTYKLYLLSDSNPLTPQNTGIHEMLVFNSNESWYKTINEIKKRNIIFGSTLFIILIFYQYFISTK